jgi:RNA polymerase sigma-70 factor (ECF subfamily)
VNEYTGFSQHISKELIELAQSGDRGAMEEIYILFANPCFCLVHRIIGNQTSAKDLVNSTFVKVMNNISGFRHTGSFAGWLRQIAVNESITYLKAQTKYLDNIKLTESTALDELSNVSDSHFDTRWWETCNDLETLTQKLSSEVRAVLFLHELEGYSHKEIGDMFGKSESFSKQSLSRAFTQLRKMILIKEVIHAS